MSLRSGATLFSWLVFPVVMFGSITLSIGVIRSGRSEEVATIAGLLFGYTIVILDERLYPFVPDWNRNHGDIPTDAAWAGAAVAAGAILAHRPQAVQSRRARESSGIPDDVVGVSKINLTSTRDAPIPYACLAPDRDSERVDSSLQPRTLRE